MGCARHTPLRANVLASLCSEHFLKTCEARGGRMGESRSRDLRVSRMRRSRARARLSESRASRVGRPRRSLSRANTHRPSTRRRERPNIPARRVVGSVRAAEARCWFFRPVVESDRDREIGSEWLPRERARTCMTVSGARPAGPTPMRMSAVAVGETSSGMVVSGRCEVEWNARARVSLVSMSDSFARTAFISQ